jgi:sialate O-acetylesterase
MRPAFPHQVNVTFFLAFWLLGTQPVAADITLPSMFSDRMVLQADVSIPLWGWAEPGEDVRIVVAGQSRSVKADDQGNWRVQLDPLKVGEVGTLKLQGKNQIVIQDVLAGEVWLASGQSNMHYNLLQKVPDQDRVLSESDDPWLRQFTLLRNDKLQSPREMAGVWRSANRTNLTASRTDGDSAVAYFFARELRRQLKRPVGVLHASIGATPIQNWMPGGKGYQTMIVPLAPFTIRGAIWYQGESNVQRSQADIYEDLFSQHVAAWRSLWSQGEFPFFYVQIAPFRYSPKRIGPAKDHPVSPTELPRFWEAQTASLKKIPNTGMAVIHDSITDLDNIHPPDKRIPGERLALLALAKTYGMENIVCEGPWYHEMKMEGPRVRLTFKGIGSGLATRDGEPPDLFEIAGEDRRFSPSQAVIEGDTVLVQCSSITKPVAVRFGWSEDARPNLMNKEGLPATPFRTDSW